MVLGSVKPDDGGIVAPVTGKGLTLPKTSASMQPGRVPSHPLLNSLCQELSLLFSWLNPLGVETQDSLLKILHLILALVSYIVRTK